MFIIIALIYSLILMIAYFGDYNSKEIEKQKEEWERVIGRKYE